MTNGGKGRTVAGVAWALSPVITLGLGTPLTFGYAAVRMKSLPYILSTGVYFALWVTFFATFAAEEGVGFAVNFIAFLLLALGGTIHALLIRPRVFGGSGARRSAFERAQEDARQRRQLRAMAAETARSDPELAREMHIGRPDLPRTYDDGGLVDINNAPAPALAAILGLTAEQANIIVDVRSQTGGFVSPEEVAALTALPPELTPRFAEYGVFLPKQ
ncbi:helix-hairpin-helix domain-containing protein [Actinomadura madurae]|uniref:helix-hairpin-helix domain-containing protein n=1 Tax=Actinomadura madurae TaxID=1993 RepID=UPI000D839BA7|nr:helix-hairpin-helix domain-containing protein [Actinomadura madurae]SPT64514.1 Helix-hairpin-helix motif [Actinomadura madurae]